MDLFEKVMQGSDADIEQFFQQMGQLVLMSSLSENEFLISAGDGKGMRRIEITNKSNEWTINEKWTSI